MTDPFRLPQVFILPQDLGFATLAQVIEGLGFRSVPAGVQTAPLIDGEPEYAAWALPKGLPAIQYAFDPVVRLRTLDVGTVPPRLRGVLDDALLPLHPAFLRDAMTSTDDRQRLFGVLAALKTERLDLIHEVATVAETARGALRAEAERAVHALNTVAEQRLQTLASTRLIALAAMGELDGLRTPEAVAASLPTEADCAALFAPQIAGHVAQAVAAARWPRQGITAQPAAVEDVHPAPAGLLRTPNEVADHFPMGYRTIAGWMVPGHIWVSWRGREPDGGQVQMDGLVFVEGRWMFFPKAYRLVEPLLPALPAPPCRRRR